MLAECFWKHGEMQITIFASYAKRQSIASWVGIDDPNKSMDETCWEAEDTLQPLEPQLVFEANKNW